MACNPSRLPAQARSMRMERQRDLVLVEVRSGQPPESGLTAVNISINRMVPSKAISIFELCSVPKDHVCLV